MKAAVIRFPARTAIRIVISRCARSGFEVDYVWHKATGVAGYDLIVLPGGLFLRRLLALWGDRAVLAGDGLRESKPPLRAGLCSESATAFKSFVRPVCCPER
jgi:hypothetical protein